MPADPGGEHLSNLVCMVYHEGRNVRHQRPNIPNAEWPLYRPLISLSSKREQAWQQMRSLRIRAATVKPSPAVAYEKQFGITLTQLSKLFGRLIWKDSYRGGNKWAEIARQVQAAVDAHSANDIEERDQLIRRIFAMEHNTGRVVDKLNGLNALDKH